MPERTKLAPDRSLTLYSTLFGMTAMICATVLFEKKIDEPAYGILVFGVLGMGSISVQQLLKLIKAFEAFRRAFGEAENQDVLETGEIKE